MDKRTELINALQGLGRHAERVAKLLAEYPTEPVEAPSNTIPICDRIIDPSNYPYWPQATEVPEFEDRARDDSSYVNILDGESVLELSLGPTYPVSVYHEQIKIDLMTDSFKFNEQPKIVRIVNSSKELKKDYDVGIAWESLEFSDQPLLHLMMLKKCCRRIYIKFRPWSSRNGAFQSNHYNLAYMHLARPVNHQVRHRVIRPLATYEDLLQKAGLIPTERKINTDGPPALFTDYPEIMDTIIARTWGNIDRGEASRIMMTDSVEYVAQ